MSLTTLEPSAADTALPDDLDVLVEQIVDTFPRLTEKHKAELGRLLSSPTT